MSKRHNEASLPKGMDTLNPVLVAFNKRSLWNPEWFHEPIQDHIFREKIVLAGGWRSTGDSIWIVFADDSVAAEQGFIYSASLKALDIVQGDPMSLPVWGELDS